MKKTCQILTSDKKDQIKELLKHVNVSAICREIGVSRSTLYQVLNGKGKKYEVVEAVAAKAIEQRERLNGL